MVTAKIAAILLANLKNYHPGIVFPKLAEIRRMTLAAPHDAVASSRITLVATTTIITTLLFTTIVLDVLLQ